MPHFVVTFRIASDATYQERYESFVDKAREIAGGGGYCWEETTSFYAFKAAGTANSVCEALYFGTQFSPFKDTMVVIDLDNRQKAVKGYVQYPHTLDGAIGF